MATGPEHYIKAEEYLEGLKTVEYGTDEAREMLAAAQVHATLALRADEVEQRIAADEEHRDLLAIRALVEAANMVGRHNGGEDSYLRSSLVGLRRASNALVERFDDRLRQLEAGA